MLGKEYRVLLYFIREGELGLTLKGGISKNWWAYFKNITKHSHFPSLTLITPQPPSPAFISTEISL